ncbi:unnamed protein product [Somion occarium]|uniref:BTB domain-containing protein n=1 Tax=Somion occarium TaxID=3059160 RepID=A0ABP1E5X5_9APHY
MATSVPSPAFHPTANLDSYPSDIVVTSSDRIAFYVHSRRILSVSTNHFASLLIQPLPIGGKLKVFLLGEDSQVLNVVFHTIYLKPFGQSPSPVAVFVAIDAFNKYGIPVDQYIRPNTPLFPPLLAHAANDPLNVYAVAGQYNLYELAAAASAHLLALDPEDVTDEHAVRMGPIYLKRLLLLRPARKRLLEELLLQGPSEHPPTPQCGVDNQRRTGRQWDLMITNLLSGPTPNLPSATIQATLSPIGNHIGCRDCKAALDERIQQIVTNWEKARTYIGGTIP